MSVVDPLSLIFFDQIFTEGHVPPPGVRPFGLRWGDFLEVVLLAGFRVAAVPRLFDKGGQDESCRPMVGLEPDLRLVAKDLRRPDLESRKVDDERPGGSGVGERDV